MSSNTPLYTDHSLVRSTHVSDLWEGTSTVLQELDPSVSGGVRIDIQHIQWTRRAFEHKKENIGVVHNVGAVLGLQDPEVPVHIGHDAWAVDVCIDHLRNDRDPVRVEGWSLDRLALLALHGSGVSHSLSRRLLKE